VGHIVLCRIANDVDGISPGLHGRNRSQQLPARRNYASVTGAEVLARAIVDRSGHSAAKASCTA
jgi:hypothetical protein